MQTMNFEKIKEMAEKDLAIDDTELGNESTRIPQLHNKYLVIFHDERLVLRKAQADYRTLRKDKWEYYTGKMSQERLTELGWQPFQSKILRNDLDVYMDSDKDLSSLQVKIEYQQEKVDYLESVLKGISQRHWVIRNSIEWRKFTNGIV
jgi:hypothetical protein